MKGKLFKRPNNHAMIVVEIDGDEYLIDTHFGYNGLRFPIKFKYGEPYIVDFIPSESYKISSSEDKHGKFGVVSLKIKDSFLGIFAFDYPF